MQKITLLILICTFFIFTSNAQSIKGEIAHFPLDDGEAYDLLNDYERGIFKGQPQVIKGVAGAALQFNGGDEQLIFPGQVNTYLRGKGDFTLSFYFRSDDLNHQRSLMGKRVRCKGYNMFDIRVGRNIGFELYEQERPNKICANVSAPIPDKGWHHYIYIRRGSWVQLYVDGQLADENRSPFPIRIDDRADFAINNSPCIGVDGTLPLKGAIDDIRVFAKAISRKNIIKVAYRYPLGPARLDAPKTSTRQGVDTRMAKIFGAYTNIDEDSPGALELNPKGFVLKLKSPLAYPDYEQLVYSGKYKIKAGQLLLLGKELRLYRKEGDGKVEEKVIPYEDDWIIGDIYDEVTIDLNAFDMRLKLIKQ